MGIKITFCIVTLGNMTTVVSQLGKVDGGNPPAYTTTYTYNAARKPLTVTDPLGHQLVNVYDVAGHILSTTDAKGNVTTFAYNLDGQSTSVTAGFGTAPPTPSQPTHNPHPPVLPQISPST